MAQKAPAPVYKVGFQRWKGSAGSGWFHSWAVINMSSGRVLYDKQGLSTSAHFKPPGCQEGWTGQPSVLSTESESQNCAILGLDVAL